MSDRVNGLFVALDADYKDSEVHDLIEAIKMLRGVAAVEQHVMNPSEYYHRSQLRDQLKHKLITAVVLAFEDKGGS